MRKAVKQLLLMAVLMLTFGLVGCGTTLTTNLSISDNFAGSRTMDLSIAKKEFDEQAPTGGFKTLALKTEKLTPECMQFSYEEKGEKYYFHFVMSFTSQEEYEEQISSILGKEEEIEFEYSNSPFSRGVNLQENFSSEDLLDWFKDYLVETKYVDAEDSAYVFRTLKNQININGTQYECDKSRLSVSQKNYIPIEEMNIFTDIDTENEKIARKIELVFDDFVMKQNRDVIESYLNSVTPTGCAGEWQTLEETEKFILVIPSCSEEELTKVMQIFCSSEESDVKLFLAGEEVSEEDDEKKDFSYSDMWDEQILGDVIAPGGAESKKYVQPFGYETTIAEKLDLTAFVCNSQGEIASSYYISTKNGKPKSMLYYANGKEGYGWDYIEEEYPEYYFVETVRISKYRVLSKANKCYVPSNIQLNTTMKSDDEMVREFVFIFEEDFEKSVIKKIKQKMKTLFEKHKKHIDISYKDNSIVWKIKGNPEKVDKLCEEIFGQGYSDISYYCQDKFALDRQYDYEELIDFRPIFDWEYNGNIDYTLKMTGKVNKENVLIGDGLGVPAKTSGKTVSYLATESGYLDAKVGGTTVHKVLAHIINLAVVTGLQTAFAIVVFRRFGGKRKTPVAKTSARTGNKNLKNKKKRV